MEYEVQWGDGPLGVTLRPDLGEDMPPVVGRITRSDSAAAIANVQVGDMLVSINGVDTARQGYDHVVEMLKRIPRPAILKFRVPRQLSAKFSVGSQSQSMGSHSMGHSERSKTPTRSSTVSTVSSTSSSRGGGGDSMSMAPPRGRNEQYTVVWTEGPLGMILRPDDDDVHVPCIRKITGRGAGTGMERATVGDVLVAVNGQETKTMGFRSTISLLKTIRKPAILKFKRMHRRTRPRTQPSRGPSMVDSEMAPMSVGAYDIVWREGDLGLKLKAGPRDVPFLSKLTGKGTASGIKTACIGDELVSVNGVPVEGNAYHDTLRMLKHSQKPAVLRFRPTRERRSVPYPKPERHALDPVSSGFKTNHHSGSNGRKRSRIPLEVAKELVAASRGVDAMVGTVNGIPIAEIQDGTREAHLLRVEAKMALTAKTANKQPVPIISNGSASGSSSSRDAPKEALLRAEQEAKVLAEALAKVKSQAEKYEKILEQQKKEKVLKPVIRMMPSDVVTINNNVLGQLKEMLNDESFAQMSASASAKAQEEEKKFEELKNQLRNIAAIPVEVPKQAKMCSKCGATEKESKLTKDGNDEYVCEDCIQKDQKCCAQCKATEATAKLTIDEDDGQYYCDDCWKSFFSTPGADTVPVPEVGISNDVDLTPAPEPFAEPVSPIKIPAMPRTPVNSAPSPLTPPSLQRAETVPTPSPYQRLSHEEREQEEENAYDEAKRNLAEMQSIPPKLGRKLSMQTMDRPAVDRAHREQRGLEEFAQALQEMEEQARANGDLALAKMLSAQRARNRAELGLVPRERKDAVDSNTNELNGSGNSNGSSTGNSTTESPSSSPDLRKVVSDSEFTPSPPSLTRTASNPPISSTQSTASQVDASKSNESAVPTPPATTDYDDVNTEDESEDQVEMSDTEDDDALRLMEQNNEALLKQYVHATGVIQGVRESMILSEEEEEDMLQPDQISQQLQEMMARAAERERESVIDMHPPDDDSDSDSNSDEGEGDGDGDGEEEGDDEGVWI